MNTDTKARESVEYHTMNAYADCHGSEGSEGMRRRNLNYCAPFAVSKEEAVSIMSEAVANGYNAFEAALLNKLPDDSRIRLAREGSVCLYVETAEEIYGDALDADECDVYEETPETKTYRIWWD